MPGRSDPATTAHSARELLGWGALVMLLGTAFVMLLVEPTQASAPVGVDRIAAARVVELPVDRPGRPVGDIGLAPGPSSDAIGVAAARSDVRSTVAAPAQAAVAAAVPIVPSGMRVRVARLGIDLPLLPGDTVRDTVQASTPIGAAFLLPSSAPPGSGGNSYIYAHARSGMFLSLWDVRLGDVVEVTVPSGETRRYRVTEIHPRVVPTDVEYTLPTGDERITLQTSTGPNDADPRFVVVAVRGS